MFVLGIDGREIISRLRPPDVPRPVIGFDVDLESISSLPQFDCVLLLSVHHQWMADQGDSAARDLVYFLSKKALKAMVVEFACLNSKYGQESAVLFEDNNSDSVRKYARN